jgi:hypothetical protein
MGWLRDRKECSDLAEKGEPGAELPPKAGHTLEEPSELFKGEPDVESLPQIIISAGGEADSSLEAENPERLNNRGIGIMFMEWPERWEEAYQAGLTANRMAGFAYISVCWVLGDQVSYMARDLPDGDKVVRNLMSAICLTIVLPVLLCSAQAYKNHTIIRWATVVNTPRTPFSVPASSA